MTENIAVDYQPLHKAVLAIKREIGTMQKDIPIDTSSGRSYSVVGYEQIIAKLQPLFLKYGINVYPNVLEASSWDTYREREENGVVIKTRETHFAKVIVDYIISDTTGVTQTIRMVGEAENDNDKAMAAALSFAWKYFAKQVFDLVTGDPDPDTVGTKVSAGAPQTQPQNRPQSSSSATKSATPTSSGEEELTKMSSSVTPNTPPPTAPQNQPSLENAVRGNETTNDEGEKVELISDSQRSMISTILTAKKDPQWPNNQGLKADEAFDFVEGVIGHPLNRKIFYKNRFSDLTKAEGKKVVDAIKQIPGVKLQERPRN